MKKFISFILCLFPIILSSLTFEFEKIDEFAVSGDYGDGHRLLIENNYMYALSHYGFEIHTVNEVTGELNRLSVIPVEGDADDIIKITNPDGTIIYDRIPYDGIFFIEENSSNTQILSGLNNSYGYTATVYAHRVVNGVTITDIDSQNFTYGTANFTLTVNLSGGISNRPPMQD